MGKYINRETVLVGLFLLAMLAYAIQCQNNAVKEPPTLPPWEEKMDISPPGIEGW